MSYFNIKIIKYFKVFSNYLGNKFLFIFSLTILSAFVENLGFLMLLPLFQIFTLGRLTMKLPSFLEGFELLNSVNGVLLFIVLLFVLKGFLSFIFSYFNSKIQTEFLKSVKIKLFELYGNMNYEFYLSKNTGHFSTMINLKSIEFLYCLKFLTNLINQSLHTIIYFSFSFYLSWRFGLIIFISVLIFFPLFRFLNNYVEKISKINSEYDTKINSLIIQSLQAFKYISSTGLINRFKSNIYDGINKHSENIYRAELAAGFTSSIKEPLAVIVVVGIFFLNSILLGNEMAPILVSILLFYRGFNSLITTQGYFQGVLQYSGSVNEITSELNNNSISKVSSGKRQFSKLTYGIELNKVNFQYDRKPILTNISLLIPANKTISFVGRSGAGKSTLIDLITLLLKPKSGEILIDNVPTEDIESSSWKRKVGFVSQDAVIFNDTVGNNICLWSGDFNSDNVLYEKLKEVSILSNIYDFILDLPDGFNTHVGDRGLKLSGGQKQRLFIARELFRNPSLLILDEATSALDSESEQAIKKSIDNLKGTTTIIIIAHRLATIVDVDKIFVFDNGRLIEEGTFSHLRSTENSLFSNLIKLQSL
jgi:ABC-type multidrug transport system fused ATPase/permease subunit